MTPLLFGLIAALCWGFGDYAGGLSARRIGVFRTTLGMEVVGTIAYAATLAVLGRLPILDGPLLVAGVTLGLLGMVSMALLYRALALGPISVVSPVTASYLALTVVLVVVFLGERLSGLQLAAIAVTFLGVILTSTDVRLVASTLSRPLPGVRIALLATLGFGLWGALFSAIAREQSALAVVLVGRAASLILLIGVFLWMRVSPKRGGLQPAGPALRWGAGLVALVVAVGVLDTAANVAFALGLEAGYASLVATGSGAYPVVSALLAIVVLGERLAPNQYAGIAVLVAGLVGLGLAT